ncbi:hypothetical protein JL49_14350 [Pseudoalteromonas luteoviolacea]|uniref:Uncharacterized protein n=1 Tax=Pseudoalteromonas luteoviolacea NCIMB 1942 TaxID=1365253 RepID=A0A167HDQ4_9GAMM|nr:hypothetical protein N482_22765 [Pseudoalteromonas luteoviolacea NCIMB 1942]KZW99944.1 hypothetical protein JL49_14350 [Pseudoalteromonas luteoviolacea]
MLVFDLIYALFEFNGKLGAVSQWLWHSILRVNDKQRGPHYRECKAKNEAERNGRNYSSKFLKCSK